MRRLYWMWLQAGLGYGAHNIADLLAAYPGGAEEIAACRGSLLQAGLVTKNQAAKLCAQNPQRFEPVLQKATSQGVQVFTLADEAYPALLKNIQNPPPVIYVKGNAGLLNGRRYVAMVGARRPSPYGMDAMKALAKDIAQRGAVVVSGLAAGLDAQAHKAALAADGDTVACIAFGHSHCYPAANRNLMEVLERHGAVVSEYPPDVGPQRAYFLQRNRIIAGLSHALVVAEARKHSGTMSTVNFAQDYGRDVFAVPGSIFSELSGGTNSMIQEGAYVASSGADILGVCETPGPQTQNTVHQTQQRAKAAEKTQQNFFAPSAEEQLAGLSKEAQDLYTCLGVHPVSLGVLCEKSGLPPAAVMAALMELEIAGLSRQEAGRLFTAVQ